jgi:hypothetical protein
MHLLAFGSRIGYPTSLTYRRPGPVRDRQQDDELPPGRGPAGEVTRSHRSCPGVRSVSATSNAGPFGEWSLTRAESPGSPSLSRGRERHCSVTLDNCEKNAKISLEYLKV